MTITITVTGDAERLLAALCETAGTTVEEVARDEVAAAINGFNYQRVDSRGLMTKIAQPKRTPIGAGPGARRSRPDPGARTTRDRHHAGHREPRRADGANARAVAERNLTIANGVNQLRPTTSLGRRMNEPLTPSESAETFPKPVLPGAIIGTLNRHVRRSEGGVRTDRRRARRR